MPSEPSCSGPLLWFQAVRNAAQDVKEGVMGMGQAAKESVTGRPTVSDVALVQPIQQLQDTG